MTSANNSIECSGVNQKLRLHTRYALPKRLQLIADCVPPGSVVADIGCDHGKLTRHLVSNGTASYIYAVDISQDSLNKTEKLIDNNPLKYRVKIVLGDGLTALNHSVDIAVIAGVGAHTILHCIDTSSIEVGEYLLMPHSKLDFLVQELITRGFSTKICGTVIDSQRKYSLLTAKINIQPNKEIL